MSRVLIAYCIITSWPHLHHDSCPEITSPTFQVKRIEANKVVLLVQRRISEVLHRRRISKPAEIRRRISPKDLAGFGFRNPRSQSFTSLRERLSLKLILGYEF